MTAAAPRTVEAAVGGVQASFFGHSYPLLRPLVRAETDLLPLASPDDIAAMKLAAIASRGNRRDFIDLWVILRSGRTLPEVLDLFSRKSATRDQGHVLRSLVYFDDADLDPPLRLLVELDWEQIKTGLRPAVAAYVRQREGGALTEAIHNPILPYGETAIHEAQCRRSRSPAPSRSM